MRSFVTHSVADWNGLGGSMYDGVWFGAFKSAVNRSFFGIVSLSFILIFSLPCVWCGGRHWLHVDFLEYFSFYPHLSYRSAF